MSLISDALNKARQEAARQEAARQRTPYAVGAIEPPRRGTAGPLLAGILVGCGAIGGLFGVAYLAGWGPWRKEMPMSGSTVAEAPPPAVAAPTPAADPSIAPALPPPNQPVEPTPVPKLPPDAIPQPPAQPPVEVPASPVPPPAPVPAAPPAVEPSTAAVEASPVAPPSPAPPAAAASPEARSYVGEAPVPGGGVLRLNGIAFSEQSPVVVLDGRVMGVGESVQGFTVVEIRRDRVRLEGHGEVVYLSLK